MELGIYNRHWQPGFRYPYPRKRRLFERLVQALDDRFIVQLTGLRRTGKTVIVFQLINHLIDRGVEPLKILYFTFDEERLRIEELLSAYSRQTGIDIGATRTFVFLDEIQKLPDFQNQLKVFYDLYPELKFFITGSMSLFLRKKTRESLAGRVRNFYLPPLHFDEYLEFVGKDHLKDMKPAFFGQLRIEFERFLSRQFIETINMERAENRREYYLSIVRKIAFEDIPMVFSVEYPELLFRMTKIIASHPGIRIDFQSLARELGISNKTASTYVEYLTESFILKRLYNFSRNLITSEKKLKKFYLASPSFSWALSPNAKIGQLVENAVISVNDYRFFWRDSAGHEVDFIRVTDDGKIVPIEVKYKSELAGTDFRNLRLFCRRFGLENGMVYAAVDSPRKFEWKGLKIDVRPIFESVSTGGN